MKNQLELGNITYEDVLKQYDVFGIRNIIEEEYNISNSSILNEYIGYAFWKPDFEKDYLRLQNVKVELL